MNSQEKGVRETEVVSEKTNLSGTLRPLDILISSIITFYVGIKTWNACHPDNQIKFWSYW